MGITTLGVRDEQGPKAVNVDVEQAGTVENVDIVDTGGSLGGESLTLSPLQSPIVTLTMIVGRGGGNHWGGKENCQEMNELRDKHRKMVVRKSGRREGSAVYLKQG